MPVALANYSTINNNLANIYQSRPSNPGPCNNAGNWNSLRCQPECASASKSKMELTFRHLLPASQNDSECEHSSLTCHEEYLEANFTSIRGGKSNDEMASTYQNNKIISSMLEKYILLKSTYVLACSIHEKVWLVFTVNTKPWKVTYKYPQRVER